MKNEQEMTLTEAAGYVTGVGFCLLQRFYRAVAILLAFAGLSLMLIDFGLTVTPESFNVKLGELAQLGIVMLFMSVAVWLVFRPWRN